MVEVGNREPLISVIMPVYNSAEFLHLAVDSVKNQTMEDWELLLIDDGSSDESGKLCDAYAEEDPRIRVFHQENSGITKTRNRGIKESRGKYITFIDNDDEYLPDILERTCSLAEQYEADIVKFGYHVDEDYPNGLKVTRDSCVKKLTILTEENLAEEYQNVRDSGYFNMIWNGIYRRSLFENEKLLFDESVIMGYEDWIFNNNIYTVPAAQVVLDYIGYIHYQRYSHSTSKKFHPNQIEAVVKAAETEYRLIRKLNDRYHAGFQWTQRATDYLIDLLSIFERQGCTYGFRQERAVIKWVRGRKVFAQLTDRGEMGALPKQRKLFLVLFNRRWYTGLLILSKIYFKYIMWKQKRNK